MPLRGLVPLRGLARRRARRGGADLVELHIGVRRLPLRGRPLVGVVQIGVDEGSFWSQMQAAVDFRYDILNGVIKSFVFGMVVTVIALYEGYDAPPTAEGVSGATTRTVVTSSLAILMLDFVLTAMMFGGN